MICRYKVFDHHISRVGNLDQVAGVGVAVYHNTVSVNNDVLGIIDLQNPIIAAVGNVVVAAQYFDVGIALNRSVVSKGNIGLCTGGERDGNQE